MSVVVHSGTPHWFGNAGAGVAQLRVEVRPALRMQELLETSVERSTRARVWWSRLIDLALIPRDFPREIGVPLVPSRLLAVVLTPLAWLRPRLGV
jgi:hypothetical protein